MRSPTKTFAMTKPVADDQKFYLGAHEANWTNINLSDPPAGGVRVMIQGFSGVTTGASRSATIFNAGQWVLPCLKGFETSETSGPSMDYDEAVASFLSTCDSGGTKRGDAFECGNEPSTSGEIDQMLRCVAGCSHRLRNAGRRVIVPHILGAGYSSVITKLNSPTAATGNCRWQMIDGFAYHTYGDVVSSRIDGLTALRSALNSAGQSNMPIFLTECGWPFDRLGNVHCTTANPGTGWPDAGYTAAQQATKITDMYNYLNGTTSYSSNGISGNMTAIKLRCWMYFSYSDYNPGATDGYSHCGLTEQDTRAGNQPAYNDSTGGGGGWVLHSTPYDGRAHGAGVAGPPATGTGPYGNALATFRALPDSTQL